MDLLLSVGEKPLHNVFILQTNFARSQRSDLGKLLFNELAAQLMGSLTAMIWQLT